MNERYIQNLIKEYFRNEYLWHKQSEMGNDELAQMFRGMRQGYREALLSLKDYFPHRIQIDKVTNSKYSQINWNGTVYNNPFAD